MSNFSPKSRFPVTLGDFIKPKNGNKSRGGSPKHAGHKSISHALKTDSSKGAADQMRYNQQTEDQVNTTQLSVENFFQMYGGFTGLQTEEEDLRGYETDNNYSHYQLDLMGKNARNFDEENFINNYSSRSISDMNEEFYYCADLYYHIHHPKLTFQEVEDDPDSIDKISETLLSLVEDPEFQYLDVEQDVSFDDDEELINLVLSIIEDDNNC